LINVLASPPIGLAPGQTFSFSLDPSFSTGFMPKLTA
jgi:hypothetical protein